MFIAQKIDAKKAKIGLVEFVAHHFPERKNFMGYFLTTKSCNYTDEYGCKRTVMKNVRSVRTDRTSSEFQNLKFHENTDYYVTPNAYYGFTRSEKNICSFDNIVIDIDFHEIIYSKMKQSINHFLYFLESDLLQTYGFPSPSIVFTGRGLQLWFALESISFKWADGYRLVASYLANLITENINHSIFAKESVIVDTAASLKLNGLFRIPGTFNKKSEMYGCILSIGKDVISIPEFLEEHNLSCLSKFHRRYPKTGNVSFSRRAEAIQLLAEKRIENGSYYGTRDLLCFCAFSSYATFLSPDKSLEKILKMNEKFPIPLKEYELRTFLKTAYKKAEEGNPYKFSNKVLFQKLQVTEQEKEYFSFSAKNKDTKWHHLSNSEKEEIVSLCKAGFNKSEIAKKVNRSVTAISVFLKEKGLFTKKEENRSKLEKAIENGMTWKDARETFSISKSAFYKIRKEILSEKNKKEKTKKEEEKQRKTIKNTILALREQGILDEDEIVENTGLNRLTVRSVLKELFPEESRKYQETECLIEQDLKKHLPISVIRSKYHVSEKRIIKIKKRYMKKISKNILEQSTQNRKTEYFPDTA